MRGITLDFKLGAIHGSQRVNQHSSNRAERNSQNSPQSGTLITESGESGLHIPVNHLTVLSGVHVLLSNRISVSQKSLCFCLYFKLTNDIREENEKSTQFISDFWV